MGYIGGYNPLILTFDPNFQRDIQASTLVFSLGTWYVNIFMTGPPTSPVPYPPPRNKAKFWETSGYM